VAQLRVLYISPLDMCASNGMAQLQHQLLSTLCSIHGNSVDLLSLGASPATARQWLTQARLPVTVLSGFYPLVARVNTTLWYGGGVLLCNKLRWVDRFYFLLRTPLPRVWVDHYDIIVCYYPWPHRLLRLERAAHKVVADLGDVMADRHERIGIRRWISITATEEKAIFYSGSRCVAVSEDDAAEFERLYGVRPSVLGFVPPEYSDLMKLDSGERPPRIGFMGAPSYANEEVLRTLAHPKFLECIACGGVELLVAGGICNTVDPSILRALESGGARVLGRIQSTAEYYRQISATVNPVGPTTGVKIKSVEALIAGRSLVTTRWGADAALHSRFPNQVIYIDWPIEPEALGRQVIEVVRTARPGGSSAARAYVDNASQTLRELHTL